MAKPRRAAVIVPLPGLPECGDCALAVHAALKDQPGVALVAVDRTRAEARIEFEGDAADGDRLADLVRTVVEAAGRVPLGDRHASHEVADEHGHAHGHAHDLREVARGNRRRLIVTAGLASGVVVLLLVGGLASGSLVLLSDAAHMFTDVASIGIAAYAVHVATRPATREKSYGWHRSEIVAAFVNAVGLWLVSAFFVVEALRRLDDPPEVHGGIVAAVGGVSLAVNLLLAWYLGRGSEENLNVRSAYLHVLSDVLGSGGALATGVLILLFGWTWADPVLTLVVTALIVAWTWRLTRSTLHILLEGTPEETDTEQIRRDLLAVPGVATVHDLHVWSLTTGVHSMTAHVVVDSPSDGPRIAGEVRRLLAERHRLDHVTIEIEPPGVACPACD